MELSIAIVLFIIGLFLIIKGGDWFVDSASWIAHAAKIPTFVVGATIVSFATTLPELTVSIMAAIAGKNELTVGNATGTIIANIGLVLGVALTFMTIKTPRKDYWLQCLLLIVSALVLWLGCLGNTLELWISIILLLIYVSFFVINLVQGRHKTIENEDKKTTKKETQKKSKKAVTVMFVIFFFILGAACIVLGSNFLIYGGSNIADSLGIPEHIVAITMIAIGTSLPELVTTISAIRKKEGGLSIGNIIGATIINITLILSTCSLISNNHLVIPQQVVTIDFPFCLAFSSIAIMPILFKQRTYRWQGILLLLSYFTYLTVSIIF